MPYTKDDESYSMYLSRINIQEVLLHAGYVHNRRDGLRYPSYVKLDSDGRRISGEKFIVNPRFNTCYKPPVIKNFNIISLITEHPDMFPEKAENPYRLVHEVCRNILGLPQEERTQNIINPQKEHKPFSLDEYTLQKFDESHVDGYKGFYPYFRYRGIDFRTQSAFKDHYVLATKTSKNGKPFTTLAFPMQIAGGDKKIVGFEERGLPRLDGSSGYKGLARGSNAAEGMWVANLGGRDLGKAKDIFWFESAYDAMAYYQLHRDKREVRKGVFVSTSGNPGINQMQNLLRNAPQATHHLCFDNDLAGRQFVANFESQLKNVLQSLPKVGSDMKEYMATVKDGAYLKGDTDLLPDDLRHAYDKYYDEAEELLSMKECGLSAPEDINDQKEKVNALYNDWKKMMTDKLCIGREQGPLKDLGTYDIPEWALCAMENGDYEGMTEEEEHIYHEFFEKHFPDGFLSNIDWDNPNEFNVVPSFGTRNPNALTSHGESPYQAVKTYPVQFFHPSEREGMVEIKSVREIPQDGTKDWNESLLREIEEQREEKQEQVEENKAAGIDLDGNGEVELSESEEKKHQTKFSHGR